jgi:hypothetical protein
VVARDGEGIAYRVDPQSFVATTLGVFDKGAASVQDIPQLEKFVMEVRTRREGATEPRGARRRT